MQYSVMVEYALHSLVYLVDAPTEDSIGIKELSEFQGLSETYLSKVFGKLTKAGIVNSVPGVKGGYKLAKPAEEISFWDVIEAVEGIKPIFQCKNILRNHYSYRDNQACSSCSTNPSCTINVTMLEGENHMREFFRSKTLSWLNLELDRVVPEKSRRDSKEYFGNK